VVPGASDGQYNAGKGPILVRGFRQVVRPHVRLQETSPKPGYRLALRVARRYIVFFVVFGFCPDIKGKLNIQTLMLAKRRQRNDAQVSMR
jgi:hypothetical protein